MSFQAPTESACQPQVQSVGVVGAADEDLELSLSLSLSLPLSLSLSLSLSLFLGRSPSESSSLSLICGFTPIKAITVYIYMPQLCFSILYVPMLCTFHYSLNKQLATVTFLVGDAYVAIIVSFLQS
jgi:hypothetical protein